MAMQPPPATDSGEEEIEVEGRLGSQTLTPMLSVPINQPTCKSDCIQKPSALIQQIKAGDGTADGCLSAHADTAKLTSLPLDTEPNWVYLADLNNALIVTIQDMEGSPRSVPEARSCSNWPHWKEAMDCEIGSLEHAET